MRTRRLVLAFAAAVAAVFLALFAADMRTWRETMRADDVRFRADASSFPHWRASTTLPSGWSERLLGVGDDRALREAIASFRLAHARGDVTSALQRRKQRGEAEAALAAVVANGDRRQASRASNLLGILAFTDATTGRSTAAPVDRSLAAFQNAVRLDPENVAAKANLELLLRLLEARGQRIGQNPSSGTRGGGRRGAGGGVPGRGY